MEHKEKQIELLQARVAAASERFSGRMSSVAKRVEEVRFSELQGRGLLEGLQQYAPRLRYFVFALGWVAVAYMVVLALQLLLPPALFRINSQNVGIIFIIACAYAAGRYGLLPGLLASVAASITLNSLFMSPYEAIRTLSITDALNFTLFLAAATIVSLMTSITRRHAQQAHQRELYTRALFTLHRTTADTFSRREALEKLQQQLESMLEKDVAFFFPPEKGGGGLVAEVPATLVLDETDRRHLEECWQEKIRMAHTAISRSTRWSFYPMLVADEAIGVLGVRPRTRQQVKPWLRPLYPAIAAQTAAVLQHLALEQTMEKTRIHAEREKLRSMLLSSVSHDLKTPLATIIGTMGMLRSMPEKISADKKLELMDIAFEEAQRLDRHITNILDMTRLESGVIKFNMQWHAMPDILQHIQKRLQHRLRNHRFVLHPCPVGVEVYMDATLTEQVLQNLLDNACKYTPHGTLIEITCRTEEGVYYCEVRDHGKGLAEEKIQVIFDKYTRLQKQDMQVAGTGLGLAIARAMMQGQGGDITAANHPEGGLAFTLRFPQWKQLPAQKARKAKKSAQG